MSGGKSGSLPFLWLSLEIPFFLLISPCGETSKPKQINKAIHRKYPISFSSFYSLKTKSLSCRMAEDSLLLLTNRTEKLPPALMLHQFSSKLVKKTDFCPMKCLGTKSRRWWCGIANIIFIHSLSETANNNNNNGGSSNSNSNSLEKMIHLTLELNINECTS